MGLQFEALLPFLQPNEHMNVLFHQMQPPHFGIHFQSILTDNYIFNLKIYYQTRSVQSHEYIKNAVPVTV